MDLNNQEDNHIYSDKIVQELLVRENSWSSMWLEYDRSKFVDDSNFEEVLDYAKNNSISLKKNI